MKWARKWGDKRMYGIFIRKTEGEGILRDLDVAGNIILKVIIKE
jgi:hypothetical protein